MPLTSEERQYYREERSKAQKAKYLREAKLNIEPLGRAKPTICANVLCGRSFLPYRDQIYCSRKCARSSRPAKKEKREEVKQGKKPTKCNVDECPNYFFPTGNQKYCSQRCTWKAGKRRQRGIEAQKLRDQQLKDLVGY